MLFSGGGGGWGGGSDGQREKVLFLLPPKEKGNKVCLIAGYCQRHSVAFYHNIYTHANIGTPRKSLYYVLIASKLTSCSFNLLFALDNV